MYESSGAGVAACACRPPLKPTDARRQATGARVSASRITTWPLATNARIACEPVEVNISMCGRTGVDTVDEKQSALAASPRSILAGVPVATPVAVVTADLG